jgi:anti-sigma factor RsiW
MSMRTPQPSAACARVRARVPALVDGALAALEEARDRGHLEACAECARALGEHEDLLARIRAVAAASAAREAGALSADLERRLRTWPARRPAPSRRWLVAAAAAALLLALRLASGDASLPRALGSASFEPLRERLPRWSVVVQGLDQLTRWIS